MPNLEEYTGEIVPLQEYTGEVISDTSPEKTSQKPRGGFASQVGAALSGENYQPVKTPTGEDLKREYAATGKSTLAELGKIGTGIGELIPGISEYARPATRYLTDVQKEAFKEYPQSETIAKGAEIAAQFTPIKKAEQFVQGAKTSAELLGRAGLISGLYGLAEPTGKESYTDALMEKTKSAGKNILLSTILGIGAIGGSKLEQKLKGSSTVEDLASRVKNSGSSFVDEAKKMANEKYGSGTKAAEDEYNRILQQVKDRTESAFKESQRSQQQLEKRARETESKIKTDEQNQSSAITESGLPQFQTSEDIKKELHPSAQLRKFAGSEFERAESKQKMFGGEAFNKYNKAASELEKTNPLHLSEVGQELKSVLDDGISGGVRGGLRTVDEQQSKILEKIRDAIFGKPKKVPSAAEIEIEAAKQPSSFSDVMKRQKAKEILMAKQEEAPPYNAKLVDDLLRELRQTEQSKLPEAGTMVARGRYGSSADLIEQALEKWVGEDIYPRQIYREASEPFNRFSTKLGEALKAQEEISYSEKKGPFVVPQTQLEKIAFADKQSTQWTKELLGSEEVDSAAEQYAVNQLKGKDSKAVKEWLNDPKNEFIDAVSDLRNKISKYQSSLASREESTKALEGMKIETQKEIEKVVDDYSSFISNIQKEVDNAASLKGVVNKELKKQYDSTVKSLDKLKELFRTKTAKEINDKWLDVRSEMEKQNVFTPQELDKLGDDIVNAAKTQKKQEAYDQLKYNIKKIIFSKLGLTAAGAAGIGSLYETYKGD